MATSLVLIMTVLKTGITLQLEIVPQKVKHMTSKRALKPGKSLSTMGLLIFKQELMMRLQKYQGIWASLGTCLLLRLELGVTILTNVSLVAY